MPVVPRLQPQVGAAPIPGVRVSPSTPPGTFGNTAPIQAANQAAGQMSEYLSDLKDREDASMAQTAYSTMVKAKNRLLYDPKDGAVTRVGRNAKGVRDEYVGAFSAEAEAIEKGLANDAQRAIFRTMRQREQQELDDSLVRHEFQQNREAEKASFGALIETVQDDALKNHGVPGKVRDSLNLMQAQALDYARNEGFGPEQTKALLTEIASSTHVGVIRQMLAGGNDLGAAAYFKEYRGEIAGRDIERVEGALKEGTKRGESQRLADHILAPDWVEDPKALPGFQGTRAGMMEVKPTLKEALEKARKIEDSDVRGMVERHIRERFRDEEIAEEQEQTVWMMESLKVLDGDQSVDPRETMDPDRWERLRPEVKKALYRAAEGKLESQTWRAFTETSETDIAKMSEMEFVVKVASRLDPERRALARTVWDAARKGDHQKLTELRGPHEVIETELKRAKVFEWGEKPTKDQEEKFRAMEDFLLSRINDFEKKELGGKRKASQPELKKVVRAALGETVKVRTGPSFPFWSFVIPGHAMTPEGQPQFSYGEKKAIDVGPEDFVVVPDMQRASIKRRLESRRKKVTEEKIQAIYKAGQRGDIEEVERLENED